MTSSTVNPHASGSGGTLRAQAQQVGGRESQTRWLTASTLAVVSAIRPL
jgi:hypothetical protein